jgi:hypothetical protein
MLRLYRPTLRPTIARESRAGGLHRGFALGLLLLSALAGSVSARADEGEIDQYKVKAAFIYNFAKYAEWPVSKLGDEKAAIVIGLWSTSPIFTQLQDSLKNRTINGHPLVVVVCASFEQAQRVHVLFVGEAEEKWAIDDLLALDKACVLTIGETDRFARSEGQSRSSQRNTGCVLR